MNSRFVRVALGALVALAVLAPRLAMAQEGDLSKAPRISIAEFKKLRAEGEVMVVDVRDAESYKTGHIPGAVSIPLDQLAAHVAELKSAKKAIVTYCA